MDRTRHKAAGKVIRLIDLPAAAVHPVLREGYAGADPRSDILTGLVAGVVALLLAMPWTTFSATLPMKVRIDTKATRAMNA